MHPLLAFDRAFVRFHRWVYLWSRGWIGHRLAIVRSLLLRSTGRRTGQQRDSILLYTKDGDGYVVVASNYGGDRAPAWFHNVRATPSVEIWVGHRHLAASAQVVEPGEADYARLWELVNAKNGGRYDRYQKRTERPIPLVRLAVAKPPDAP
jgi:deazaflavin-dependent oxidoreductase (nitroreductase family)